MFFGYGKSSSNLEIPDSDRFILTTFHYFHIIFLLRVTFLRKWFLVDTVKSDSQIKVQDRIPVNQKALQKWEVDKLLGQNPVNLFWIFFNQSLLLFILGIVIFTMASNFLQTGDIAQTPPKTVSQIIESKYWTKEEEQLVTETASDEDFLRFLSKFRSRQLASKALIERNKIKKLKLNSSPSLENSKNTSSSISSTLSDFDQT